MDSYNDLSVFNGMIDVDVDELHELLLLSMDAPQENVLFPAPYPTYGAVAPLPGAPEENAAFSSASSPSSSSGSASTAYSPAVPVHEAPAESPAYVMPPDLYVEPKNEMVAVPLQGRRVTVESPPAASSTKRKYSARKEADNTKAAPVSPAPVAPQQLSKRARANERNRKREAHNQAERERRDDLKECYASLRTVLPTSLCPDRKNTVELLQAAIEYIKTLQTDEERIQRELTQFKAQAPAAFPAGFFLSRPSLM